MKKKHFGALRVSALLWILADPAGYCRKGHQNPWIKSLLLWLCCGQHLDGGLELMWWLPELKAYAESCVHPLEQDPERSGWQIHTSRIGEQRSCAVPFQVQFLQMHELCFFYHLETKMSCLYVVFWSLW